MPPVRTSLANTPSCFSCCTNSNMEAWGERRRGGTGALTAVRVRASAGLPAQSTLCGGERGLGDEALPPRAHLRSRDGHGVDAVVAGRHDARGAALLTLLPGQAWEQKRASKGGMGSRHPHTALPREQAPPHSPPQGGECCPGGPNDSCRAAPLRGSFIPAVVWSQAEVSLIPSYRWEPVSGPTPGLPERALASLSQQPLRLSLVSSRPHPCLSQV